MTYLWSMCASAGCRAPGEAETLKASRFGRDVFFSHDDAARFYERAVESPTPAPGESVTLFAISKAKYLERLDMEPARRVLGYVPQDVWPEGLPFAVENP